MESALGPAQAIVQDPHQMLAIFRAHLRPPGGEPLDVRSCQIDYARHSETRSVLQYTLTIAGANGQLSSQVVTGASFGAERTKGQWSRLLAAVPNARKAIGPLALPAATYLPDLDLLLQVFPFDLHLPGLLPVAEGAPKLFAALCDDAGPGQWRVEQWRSDVARYRPDMRATLRVEYVARHEQSGHRKQGTVYAKVFRERDEARHAHRLLQALWAATQHGELGFGVAQPLAYLDDLQTLLLSEVPGERVLEIARQGSSAEAESALRRAGRAIAGLHQVALPADLLPRARKEKEKQIVTVSKLARRYPEQAQPLAALIAGIEQALVDTPLAPTHNDLKQGHMLLAGERVTILDFDKLALGDPLIDVANVAATLGAEREGSRNRKTRRAGLAEAFVEEYFARVPPRWRAAFPAHYALAALVEAGTTGRGQRGRPKLDDHGDRVDAAIAQAQRAMRGELW